MSDDYLLDKSYSLAYYFLCGRNYFLFFGLPDSADDFTVLRMSRFIEASSVRVGTRRS